ncbi:MAG: protein kinase [Acidobacteria bacterium]|nr:protein kinase [Acidobacteriota bacterium]
MIGTTVGHIRIIGLLGQGGMGEVYLGFDERLQRRVALKAIRNEARLSADSRQRLLREARALSALDDPNICRIYDYAEGPSCDFLVLELVEGITLGRAIEQGMSRTRKLRVAREVVRALGAAHRRGIVHRDLKPDNIMITPTGAVKILDFGIARFHGPEVQPLREEELDLESADTLIFRPAIGEGGTAVVGTPLYMSPEQALGATVTTASDLFSFGLVLQMMLTEQAPRGTDKAGGTLLQRAAAGDVLPMTAQPRPLTALVTRLCSFAPAVRPTAVETQEILDRILAAPARRARITAMILTAALFVAGGIKYAFDVTAARRDAERRRHQAEDLVAFMVSDLPKRLEPVGRLDALDGAAAKALEYFASQRPEELSGEQLQRYALALTQLGDVRIKQGKLPEALAMFRQSLRFAAAAAAQDPNRDEWQLALSNSHFWVGDALRRTGDAHGALTEFRAYYEVSRRLAARHPGEAKYQAELSYGHSNLGSAYESLGDLVRAAAEYRTASGVDRQRVNRSPADDQARADLANSLNKLGVLQQITGDLAGARQAFEEDTAIRRFLLQKRPDDAGRAIRLATSLSYLGSVHLDLGETGEAVDATREELAFATRLAERDAQNLDWQRRRAVAEMRLAETLGARGEDAEGARLLADADVTLTDLAARDKRPTWQRDLAGVHYLLARFAARRGDVAGAREHGARAVSLAEQARAKQTSDLHAARILCDTLTDLAELEAQQQRAGLARQYAARVVTLAAAAPYAQDLRIRAATARALVVLGRDSEGATITASLSRSGYRRPPSVALPRAAASP